VQKILDLIVTRVDLQGDQIFEQDLINSEELLVKECMRGSKLAQKVMYEMYYKIMLGVCYKYADDAMEAEDLMHEGFMKVFKRLDKFNFKSKLKTWISRVMINNVLDHHRKKYKKNMQFLDDKVELVDDQPAFNENEIDGLSCNQIIELMKQMPPGYRAVLMLYSIEGYKHAEIAEELKISESSSRSQLLRARKHFRTILDEWRRKNE
jgi:RNA polymerase sigma factor (sigma-70 family)